VGTNAERIRDRRHHRIETEPRGHETRVHHEYIFGVVQTIFVGKDGRGTRVANGTTIQYKAYDLYDRPWARIWEEYFEKDMKRPKEADPADIFSRP
jgi:hypothetical protein